MDTGYSRLLIEIGIGIDQHGQDANKAAERAIRDAIQRVCIPGFRELGIAFDETVIDVDIYVPWPEKIDAEKIKKTLPAKPRKGEIRIRAHKGGALVHGIYMPEYGDKGGEIVVAVAAITIWVKPPRGETVNKTWWTRRG